MSISMTEQGLLCCAFHIISFLAKHLRLVMKVFFNSCQNHTINLKIQTGILKFAFKGPRQYPSQHLTCKHTHAICWAHVQLLFLRSTPWCVCEHACSHTHSHDGTQKSFVFNVYVVSNEVWDAKHATAWQVWALPCKHCEWVCMCSLHEIRSDNGKLCMSAGAVLVAFAALSKLSLL